MTRVRDHQSLAEQAANRMLDEKDARIKELEARLEQFAQTKYRCAICGKTGVSADDVCFPIMEEGE